METTLSHFGQWGLVLVWALLGSIFILFIPFYKKSQRKPASVYIAFMVAMAFEMFGVPMSMYILAWVFGTRVPEGVLWGHTLFAWLGHTGLYIGTALAVVGIVLVVLGWRAVYQRYWRKASGEGELVTDGIYRYIRHPQYTGFMLITLGMMLDWATLPMLVMWPILGLLYYKLARREERELEAQFGPACRRYMERTSMFVPLPRLTVQVAGSAEKTKRVGEVGQ